MSSVRGVSPKLVEGKVLFGSRPLRNHCKRTFLTAEPFLWVKVLQNPRNF